MALGLFWRHVRDGGRGGLGLPSPGGGGRRPDGGQAAQSPRISSAVVGCSGGVWSLA